MVSTHVRDLLEQASDDVPEVDLAQVAWDAATAQRRAVRRRVLLGASVTAGVAAVATVVVRDRAGSPSPRPDRGPVGPQRLASADVGGVDVALAPEPGGETLLPRYGDAQALALGRSIGFEDAGPLAKLGPDTGLTTQDAAVRAVLLAWSTRAEGMLAVLHTPGGGDGREYLVCTGVPLVRADSTQTGQGMLLDPRTIRDDRRAVVLPQPGEVVVLDARTGTADRIPVPDRTLFRTGWAKDNTTVVATGTAGTWLVDTVSGRVQRPTGPVGAGWLDVATDDDGTTAVRSFAASGALTGIRALRGPVLSVSTESVSNTEGWVAAHAYLGQTYAGAVARSQGLVAVQADVRPTPRVLASTRTPGVPKGAYRPLLWGPGDVVILESRSFQGLSQVPTIRLLAWNVIDGTLAFVGEVGPVRAVGYGFTGAFSL